MYLVPVMVLCGLTKISSKPYIPKSNWCVWNLGVNRADIIPFMKHQVYNESAGKWSGPNREMQLITAISNWPLVPSQTKESKITMRTARNWICSLARSGEFALHSYCVKFPLDVWYNIQGANLGDEWSLMKFPFHNSRGYLPATGVLCLNTWGNEEATK